MLAAGGVSFGAPGKAAHAAGAETDTLARPAATERIADLADTIHPILIALADGGTADADIQRRAQVEYQRLRALFDESAAFDHVLVQEPRPVARAIQDGLLSIDDLSGRIP